MSIKIVLYSSSLRRHANDRDTVEVSGNTLGQCLDHLVKQFPGIKDEIFGKDGQLLNHYCIFVKTREITFFDEPGKPVQDGDELAILPMISGG